MSWRFFLNILFLLLIYIIKFYIRYLNLADYMLCYACGEMDSLGKTYDYIVVGSGSAGSVIARRLAEDKNAKILLLEAGAYVPSIMNIPSISLLLQKTNYDWGYKTVPQKHACKAFSHKASTWPMGKVVGGTFMLNNMLYTRGHPNDYAEWYKDVKNYNYEKDILPYFKKLENFMNDTKSNIKKGSTVISDPPFFSMLTDYILEGIRLMKLPLLGDPIIASEGFSKPKATIYQAKRRTTAKHLLELRKKNIVIRTQVTVKRVLFKKNYEAHAVKYLYLNDYYYAKAKKAVILCAGVIGSPKILMLSGVGPKSHLKSVGVKPRINLPVGDNLQDHVTTGLDLVLLNNASLDVSLGSLLHPMSVYNYFLKGSGPWATTGCDVIGYLNEKSLDHVKHSDCNEDAVKAITPHLQFMIMPVGISADDGVYLKSLVDLKKSIWKNYFQKITNTTAISILPVVLHPKSRGTVRLGDYHVYTNPVINPNYLTHQYDIDMLLKGIHFIKEIIKTEPMKSLGASLNNNTFPGCESNKFDTKEYWECYVRHLTLTSYHPVGTCKMGEGISSVVDFNFRVRNTNKLYVVDGSVMPSLISGNVNAAIIMLAEKAADSIKHDDYLNNYYCDVTEIFIPKPICDLSGPHQGRWQNSKNIVC